MSISIVLAMAVCLGSLAQAQLQVLTNREAQSVFAGEGRKIAVTFRNSGAQTMETQLSTQVYQTSSATAVPVSKPADWKKLQIAPGQTVLESASVDFPAVKAETKCVVQWLTEGNHAFGSTEVRVYPADLLAKLKTLAGDGGPGIYDPQNELKPLLKTLNVEFADLEDSGLEHFSGRLAIIGPFQSATQMREGLDVRIKELARKGTEVVWLQPPPPKKEKLMPSFYSVMENTNTVVVVQADLVSGLAENPQAQLNLVYFCQMALRPEPLHLPRTNTEP